MNTMGFISAATNYNCTDCHVEPKVEGDWTVYAQETPRKATARRMILMVQAINRTDFGGARVVTCYTCHRNLQGAPKITPSLAEQYGEPPAVDPNEVEIARQATGAPSADQVFDKYLQAVGGAQKAAAVTSIVFKGTYEGYAEPKAPVDIYVKAPNQRTMIVHTDGGDRTTTFDGSNGWMAAPPADKPFPVISYTNGDLDAVRLDAALSLPARIKQAVTKPLAGSRRGAELDLPPPATSTHLLPLCRLPRTIPCDSDPACAGHSLQRGDVVLGTGAHVRSVGKGRKERYTPLARSTVAVLKAWLR